jgi:DNA-directed RNA polymerase III subunit RPC2
MVSVWRTSRSVVVNTSRRRAQSAALASANECPRDPGGYFVVRGTEKVLLIQEQLSKNRIIIERDTKGQLVASVTSSANNFKSRCQVVVDKQGRVCVRHNNFAEEINAGVLLLAMGVPTAAAAQALIGADLAEALQPTLAACVQLRVRTELEALEYIGARLRQPAHWRVRRRRDAEAREVLVQVVLAHVATHCFDLRDKAAYVALMMRRLLLAMSDEARVDDRDYYGNKRLELAGQLLALLFEDLFKRFNSDLKRNIDKSLEKRYRTEQFDAIKLMRPDTIATGLIHAISTGNWNVKRFKMERAGVTAVLSRLSFIASLGMMTRITSQFEKTRKISGPRALQPSQWGMLCPSDTPEGACARVRVRESVERGVQASHAAW